MYFQDTRVENQDSRDKISLNKRWDRSLPFWMLCENFPIETHTIYKCIWKMERENDFIRNNNKKRKKERNKMKLNFHTF